MNMPSLPKIGYNGPNQSQYKLAVVSVVALLVSNDIA